MAAVTDISPALAARLGLLAVVLGASVVTDVRSRRIPNAVTYPAIVAGLLLGLVAGGPRGAMLSAAGALVGGAIFLPLATLLRFGMGDVKLAMAIGAFGGPEFALWASLYGMVAGGVAAVVALRRGNALRQAAAGMAADVSAGTAPRPASGLTIPYAVPLAAGALLALASPGLPR